MSSQKQNSLKNLGMEIDFSVFSQWLIQTTALI